MNINFFAGPGAGKSRTAAATFNLFKEKHINVELVTEFAKDLTHSEHWNALACQPYVFGEQLWRQDRLKSVDYVITDSPILLSATYGYPKYPESWGVAVVDIFNLQENINFFINRSNSYLTIGRSQSLAEAIDLDHKIKCLLDGENIKFTEISGSPDDMAKVVFQEIFEKAP